MATKKTKKETKSRAKKGAPEVKHRRILTAEGWKRRLAAYFEQAEIVEEELPEE